ncbi:hypothetical protein Poly24_36280 [Rosistilla carotiformis]|uniref:Uncharacterized protein n=1 Tax=Rosistilla carotiformis TaxID=2528017 RepID=A0A518JWJ2_9BACT|nr:hypothetical protein [Rosistilla carotiformis]QDV69910.1 hypothetical protein Poly24_36280 [Rosistilla carotiformis]
MKIVPLIVTYNGGASGPCIMRCVDFLMAGEPDSFGNAIEQIDIYPRCQTRDPIITGLEFMLDRFQEGLATLPFIRFRRKARLFEVSYASAWVHSDSMFRSSITTLPPSEFDCLVREFATALSFVRSRVKKSDDFDVDAFDAHVRRRVESLDQPAGSHADESANNAVNGSRR